MDEAADLLAAHLAALPAPQLDRIAQTVLHAAPTTRALAERALTQRLLDPQWIAATLDRLSDRATQALASLVRAGVPVVRRDASALASDPNEDPLEALEDHGLVTPVRTGRGMPTHVAITPGMMPALEAYFAQASTPQAGSGLRLAAARRRFDLALFIASVGQHPPRLTRQGRLHAGDLASLAATLEPLGLSTGTLERRLADLLELGAVAPDAGRLKLVPEHALDIEHLALRLALLELAAPSTPEPALAMVSRLLPAGTQLPLRELLEAIQAELLRERAAELDEQARSARRELAESLGTLVGLSSLLLLDDEGRPLTGAGDVLHEQIASRSTLHAALDPQLGALLRGERIDRGPYEAGHVQSSFEVIAGAGANPSLVARIALCASLNRADWAAVLRLERRSVTQAASLGLNSEELVSALAALSPHGVPANVEVVVRDWFAAAEHGQPPSPLSVPALEQLRDAALAALPAPAA